MALDKLRFDSGRVSLDLLATVGSRLGHDPIERIASGERLEQWLVGSGLVPAGQPLAFDTEEALPEIREIRALLHRVIHQDIDGQAPAPEDLRRVNNRTAIAPPAVQMTTGGDGGPGRRLVEPITLPALSAAICRDAVDLLTGTDRAALRRCEGETCDLAYLDHSRGHRRRWCSSGSCGNRDRVARYRSRHQEATPPAAPEPPEPSGAASLRRG